MSQEKRRAIYIRENGINTEEITRFIENGKKFVHYTCNAPSESFLKENGILPIGQKFGIEDRGVVLMTKELFENLIGRKLSGNEERDELILYGELAMRKLKEKERIQKKKSI